MLVPLRFEAGVDFVVRVAEREDRHGIVEGLGIEASKLRSNEGKFSARIGFGLGRFALEESPQGGLRARLELPAA